MRIPREHWDEVEAVYVEYGGEMLGFARRLLCERRDVAPDIVQEVFQAAARQWGRLQVLSTDRRRAWLFGVLKNMVFAQWRKVQPTAPVLEEGWSAVSTADTSRQAVSRLLLQRCWDVIDVMPSARRRIALLRWSGDWSTKEIADHLGLAESTVRVQLARARHALVEELGTEVIFPEQWWAASAVRVER
ncbi:RNA polymerase sigma factor [Streptomyces jumonjinensis]|uniref:RNA polymerase sigma factor n=1 Tax=Streptomyces jumonjinensis TaxID=1945 RepID=UPI0037A51E25